MNLTNPDLRYVLVQNKRIVGTSTYDIIFLQTIDKNLSKLILHIYLLLYLNRLAATQHSADWGLEATQLPEGALTIQSVNDILAFINKWGSHFVSAVDFGDILYQVNTLIYTHSIQHDSSFN